MREKNTKKIVGIIFTVAVLVMAVVGTTYAWLQISVRGNSSQTIKIGSLSLVIHNEKNAINLKGALPVTDEMGKKNTPYTFTLENQGKSDLNYVVKLVPDLEAQATCSGCSFMDPNDIRYEIVKDSEPSQVGALGDNANTIYSGEILGYRKNEYQLKIWISSEATSTQNKYFYGKIEVSATQTGGVADYVDNSGAASPELVDGLIPVVWNGTDWVSADTKTEWFNYDEQWWANAVTTTETNRAKYQVPGTVIPMSDINTMWVWVPRYEYQFSNMATGYAGGTVDQPGGISINFIDKGITSPSDSSNYAVHPAFTFGNQELSGIWVGKFETGNQTACAVANGSVDTACDLTTLGVQIKPNVSSWCGIRISTAFTVSHEMSNAGNVYGLNNATTDSHMIKNTEWGAVAYLSQSVYGKYANSAYTGANKEVYINNYWNNSQTLTGCSAGAPSTVNATSCAYTYEKSNTGTGASTTGNIYGIYDMSGGAYEYVMGNMKANGNTQQQSGYSTSSNQTSGFNGPNYTGGATTGGRAYPAAKYYDTYNYSASNKDHSTRYIPGDATYEVSQEDGKNNGWYSDYANFVSTSNPWFLRGGFYGAAAGAGMFSFASADGGANGVFSFRLVLTPTI